MKGSVNPRKLRRKQIDRKFHQQNVNTENVLHRWSIDHQKVKPVIAPIYKQVKKQKIKKKD